MTKKLLPSRFNAVTQTDDGGLMVFNSYTGAIASFSEGEKASVSNALRGNNAPPDIINDMKDCGFLVPEGTDELRRAQYLHQSMHRTDLLHLVLLPTEACNFRCTYCYETFPRGKMDRSTMEGLKHLVQQRSKTVRDISISWFGGEPLLALDVIQELSQSFLAVAKEKDIHYSADIVTNGYLLTEDVFRTLLDLEIRHFMITIDGLAPVHDKRRVLAGGGATFDRVMSNLKALKKVDGDFELTIRVNFDEDNRQEVTGLNDFLQEHFSDDKRFQTYYRPVGRWGGENDDEIPVCNRITADHKIWEFSQDAIQKGLAMSTFVENSLMPTGSVCYAAKPYSLVVGSNGKLYKCTISFDEEVNQVGQIHGDGSLDLDYDKIMMWTTSGEETDSVCQSCFYRPACQGNHCPLFRMRTGERPCPYEKRKIKKVLQLIWEDKVKVMD